MTVLIREAGSEGGLEREDVQSLVAQACSEADYRNSRVLVIVPDATRTAPVDLLFRELEAHLRGWVRNLDVLVALGTHPPMSEPAINHRLGITEEERSSRFGYVRYYNHSWDRPESLRTLGSLAPEEIRELSGGRFEMEVPVQINRRLFDYDRIILIGPVFPHEVVGFSGGNKYLFPGVAGPQLLNFFHWLGAVITTPKIIGNDATPVRRVIDRAAAMVQVPKLCLAMVVTPDKRLKALCMGTPETAWQAAVPFSKAAHIRYVDRAFHTILSCAPGMYDELWTGGKCMYKLEPVLADDGELTIYAPHITEVSATHGHYLDQIGYHCRDFFLKQWDRYRHYPWGVLAHSAHVYGLGTYDGSIEKPRARVTLATGIPEARCRKINLPYRDPAGIVQQDWAGRESEGILLVPRAGETLYRLRHSPPWARSD